MIPSLNNTTCPGCGLMLPINNIVTYDGYYHVSQECWGIYTQVLEREFSNPILFKQIHSLTVDTYAVQHAGGIHKDKSVAVHLTGLYLMIEKDMKPSKISRIHQLLARRVKKWPHFKPPKHQWVITIQDVFDTSSPKEHVDKVYQWANEVWKGWQLHYPSLVGFITTHLNLIR